MSALAVQHGSQVVQCQLDHASCQHYAAEVAPAAAAADAAVAAAVAAAAGDLCVKVLATDLCALSHRYDSYPVPSLLQVEQQTQIQHCWAAVSAVWDAACFCHVMLLLPPAAAPLCLWVLATDLCALSHRFCSDPYLCVDEGHCGQPYQTFLQQCPGGLEHLQAALMLLCCLKSSLMIFQHDLGHKGQLVNKASTLRMGFNAAKVAHSHLPFPLCRPRVVYTQKQTGIAICRQVTVKGASETLILTSRQMA